MALLKMKPNYFKLLENWVKNLKWTLQTNTSYFGLAHNT